MAVRVTQTEVRLLIVVDSSIVTDYTPFIEAANTLINNTIKSSSVNEATKKVIEKWLSAHFIAISDMRKDTEKADEVSEKNQYRLGLNLQVTMYGQQAIALDHSQALANLNSGKSLSTSTTVLDVF